MTASLARPASFRLDVGDVLEAESGCRYEVLEQLGHGGMAEVYRARGTRQTGFTSEVALKCLLERHQEQGGSGREFLHEAEVSGYLSHPNIARATDLERIAGRLYLVLEFVDGVNLRAVTRAAAERKSPMTVEFACYTCAAIAEALGYAHSLPGRDGKPLGIIHRDVSPANVMLTKKGVPKLLDFGIAFARMPDRDRTGTGVVLGTYSYLSPEQAAAGRAAAGEVDARSDLFSLGLVLVELLTGSKVFRGEDELLTAQAIAECSLARVNEATRELPSEMQRVCRRLLARKPADRFQSGEDVAQELRAILAECDPLYGARECVMDLALLGLLEPEPGGKATRPRGVRAWRRRGPLSWVVGTAAAMALGIGVGAGGGVLAIRRSAPSPTPVDAHATAEPAASEPGETAPSTTPQVEAGPAPAASGAVDRSSLATEYSTPASVPVVASSTGTSTVAFGWPNGSPVRRRTTARKGVSDEAKPMVEAKPEAAPAEPPIPEPSSERRAGPATHGALQNVADRRLVSNASGTLPRGAVMRVRLNQALVPEPDTMLEAMVTEDASIGGHVVVPRGAVVTCRVVAMVRGRVTVQCEAAAAGERAWSFSALALGEDNRAGLKATDGAVPVGTSFSVAVTASAMLE